MEDRVDKPWTHSWQDVVRRLGVVPDRGLDEAEIKQKRQEHGLNLLQETRSRGAGQILVDQFKSLIVLLLVVAAGLSFAFDERVEGVAILAVILINTAIGFFTEMRATRSMEALRRLGSVSAKVRREGQLQEIPAEELVPGDIVVLEGGDIVTADLRLFNASKLQADESALTGESVPVDKQLEPLGEETPLAERTNMLFKGTAITRGSAEGVVWTTGMQTELGHISSLVEEAEEERTPLEERLDQLGRRLIGVTLIIAAVVSVVGILTGKQTFLMIETGIALAVATIPEGLPVVATMALARGMWKMARRNALVTRLSAVETLGATNVICTDKTGTLTENRMTVTRIDLDAGEIEIEEDTEGEPGGLTRDGRPVDPSDERLLQETLRIAVLCNSASLQSEDGESGALGDPMEIALLMAGSRAGLHREELLSVHQEVREEAFDSDVKMMATFHREDGGYRVAVKGAPESVLAVCSSILGEEGERELHDEERTQWLERNTHMAEEGLRVLALASRAVDSVDIHPYQGLTFLGLLGLVDPPRMDVRGAIGSCKEAGVRIVMVTGDQPVTARNIGAAVGLVEEGETDVIHGQDLQSPDRWSEEDRRRILGSALFARVSPKQKLDLIDLHQNSGSVVAMTGDGVNDAPALKKADIGVAMGQRGTQVAREAADMVLKDDAFSTIVVAVEQGRIIFGNIRKVVLYLLSCNVSEVMVVALASLVNAPLPILPLQILFINLVTDVFPALALGVGEGDAAVMKHPPRDPGEPILTRSHWRSISGYGVLITLSVLGAFTLAFTWLDMGPTEAVSVSFLTLAFSQLWHVFNMRDRGTALFRNDIIRNPFIWGALALCVGLLLAAVYLPGLASVLKVVHPGAKGWMTIIAMSLIPWLLGSLWKSLHREGSHGNLA